MFFIIYRYSDFRLSSESKVFRSSFTVLHSAIFIVIKPVQGVVRRGQSQFRHDSKSD